MKKTHFSVVFFCVFLNSSIGNGTLIVNEGEEFLHLSYENKFGEIESKFIEPFETLDFKPDFGQKMRLTFEYNAFLFPVIVDNKDLLKVRRKGNFYYFSNEEKETEVYYQLSEKFNILKTPFTGIEYSRNTKYLIIYDEIKRLKSERLKFIQNLNSLSTNEKKTYNTIIYFRFVDEMLSPFYQTAFLRSDHISSTEYLKEINSKVNEAVKYNNDPTNINLTKQYYWGILQYLIFKNKISEDPIKEIGFVLDYFRSEELQHYLIWRLYRRDFIMIDKRDKYEAYFAKDCNDKDYIMAINRSFKPFE